MSADTPIRVAVDDTVFVVSEPRWRTTEPLVQEHWTVTKVGSTWITATDDPQAPHRARRFSRTTGVERDPYGATRLRLYRDKAAYDEFLERERLWRAVTAWAERNRMTPPRHLTTAELATVADLLTRSGG